MSDEAMRHSGKKIAWSTSSNAVVNVVVALLGTVSLRVMTTHLGPTRYGVFVTVVAFVSLAMLVSDLGVNALTGRDIAREPERAAQLLSINVGLRLTTSLILVPLSWLIGALVYAGHVDRHEVIVGLLIVGLGIPFDAMKAISTSQFVARIENHLTALVNLVAQVVFVSLAVIFVLSGLSLTSCFVAYLLSVISSSTLAVVLARRRVAFRPSFDVKKWPAVLKGSLTIGSVQVTNAVYARIDVILMSVIAGSAVVANYGVATAIIGFFLAVPMIYMTSTMPLLATAGVNEVPTLISRAIRQLSIFAALVIAGCASAGPGVISLLAGTKYRGADTALIVLSIAALPTALSAVYGYAAFSRDRHHRLILVSLAGLVINVIANVAMIGRLGATGSAWAMVISELVLLMGNYVVTKRALSLRSVFMAPVVRPLIAAGVTITIERLLFDVVSRGTAGTIVALGTTPLVFLGTLFVIGGLNEEIRSFRNARQHRAVT